MQEYRRTCVAALAVAAALAACESQEDELFTAPYRTTSPSRNADGSGAAGSGGDGRGGVVSSSGGQSSDTSGGDSGQPCNPEFCPSSGFSAGCCLPDGAGCGIDFGFGCVANPMDAGAGGAASVDVRCQGDADCSGGQRCCGVRSGQSFTAVECRNQCGGSNLPIRCGVSSHCSGDQICCGTTTGTGTSVSYSSIECADACGETGQYVLCDSGSDCSGGTQCQASTVLPSGFTVCR